MLPTGFGCLSPTQVRPWRPSNHSCASRFTRTIISSLHGMNVRMARTGGSRWLVSPSCSSSYTHVSVTRLASFMSCNFSTVATVHILHKGKPLRRPISSRLLLVDAHFVLALRCKHNKMSSHKSPHALTHSCLLSHALQSAFPALCIWPCATTESQEWLSRRSGPPSWAP